MIAPSLLESHLISPLRPARRFRRRGDAAVAAPVVGSLLIRLAGACDAAAVARLEAMEDRALPAGPRLLAEVEGRAVAAVALADGSAVADPFERGAAVVELLRLRARQLRAV